MENVDLKYICTITGNLTGIPIRIYEKEQLVFYHSIVDLPKDPICISLDEIFNITAHVGYHITPFFYFYGVINSADTKIVIGPSRQIKPPDNILKEIAFKCDVEKEDIEQFIYAMKSIIPMPYESIMQTLCTINYIQNGEKLGLDDITIYDDEQKKLTQQITTKHVSDSMSEEMYSSFDHNTLSIEQAITDIVRNGDTAALKAWVSTAPAVRAGIIAPDQLRQYKNTFIVTATLVSRAAIKGGMAAEDAFTLSDLFIQKCELLSDPARVINLQFNMVADYTEQVAKIRSKSYPTKLALDVSNYVRHHILEPITAENIAKELYISRPYLSSRFKKDTGLTLTDYILKEKTDEAKRLLHYTDKSIATIGLYLGFSSQSHFFRVFKKYCGMSPKEYRKKNI